MNLFAALTLTVATVFAVSNPASAACTRPAKISIPDGKTMKAAQARLTPYAKDMNVYLHCLADEIKNGKDEYEAVAADWTRQSEAFKNTPAPAK